MQGANKTIITKVGLDLPMSEQVRQGQVTLNEGKTLVNTKGVYGSKFGNETHFLSFAAIVQCNIMIVTIHDFMLTTFCFTSSPQLPWKHVRTCISFASELSDQ